ncbi:uncharacterized protein LOC135113371 [Scylla paramamosain]|uniref:uncharacterized protein LOC135113371 n=1 Tax=Scylla paramamosain TaxID=85552 RepID=UPI003082EDEC
MVRPDRHRHQFKVISANVRGLRTNIGDLTHNCVLRYGADAVVVTETWLNGEVEPSFGKIGGYTHWARRDRQDRAGGRVPVCFREGVQAQQLGVDVPPQLEVMFFRVVLANHSALLLCATYRLPRQGPDSLLYLKEAPDVLLVTHRCQHILLVGDLNHHLERDAYENLLTVQGLKDHVTFPTHERGGILDPVISDLEEDTLSCHQLGLVGSSYHHAVLTQVDMGVARDEATTRTGGAEVQAFTSRLLALQEQHVPHREFVASPTDQPWFGYRCRVAAEAKYSAWLRYKQSATRRNKDLHRAACKRMVTTCRWAVGRWEEDLRRQLGGPGVSNKTWWSLVKGRQGLNRQDTVPPLTRPDGTVVTSSKDKAQLLATLFAGKMEVDDPERSPPLLEQQCRETVTKVEVTQGLVERLLQGLDVQKAAGPDNISPHVLKQCARELAVPLTTVFSACLWENTWPLVWKEARDNYLLSDQQFGFRPGRSTSDLLMLLTGGWQDALDGGLDSVVVVLDIAGAFDREWGARWQVTFAPEKTQAMVVSRSPAAEPAVEGGLSFGGLPLELQESVKILGVEVDQGLRFDRHLKHIALKASYRVSSLRRVANLLDRRGRLFLYKAQIRPYLEYAAISWMSCAATHISKLDGIQRRVLRLVEAAGAPAHPEVPIDTLEHRRDVAALVVFHKAQADWRLTTVASNNDWELRDAVRYLLVY